MGSFDKEVDFKLCLIFCFKGYVWELVYKFFFKRRGESDNKRRVMNCEILFDRLFFLELVRKVEMDVMEGKCLTLSFFVGFVIGKIF